MIIEKYSKRSNEFKPTLVILSVSGSLKRAIFLFFAVAFFVSMGMAPRKIQSQTSKRQEENAPANRKTDLLQQAERLYFQKRYRSARRILQTLLELDGLNARAHLYLGDIHLKLADYKEAEESYRMALELSDRPAEIHFRLGQTLYHQGKAQDALGAFAEALKQDPTLVSCHFQMGLVYLMLLRDRGKAIEHWKTFRELAPDDPQGPEIDLALALLARTDAATLENCETTKQQALCNPNPSETTSETQGLLERDDL